MVRCLNLCRLSMQFLFSRMRRRLVLSAMPFSISVEPTNKCNLACPECVTGSGRLKRKTGVLSFPAFSCLMDEVSSELIHLFLYFQGEPMLNPDFLKMVAYAKSKGVFVATSTNGHFLTDRVCDGIVESGLDHIVISLDGVRSSSYSVYRRNGDFERVRAGISRLVETRSVRRSARPLIELQFIVFRHNEDEVGEFKLLAKTLGVDKATIKTAQIYDVNDPRTELLPPRDERYSRYVYDGTRYRPRRKGRGLCWRQWSAGVVTCDGSLAPCCFDKEAECSYGNVFDSGFSSCWFSVTANGLRSDLLYGRRPGICKDCPE